MLINFVLLENIFNINPMKKTDQKNIECNLDFLAKRLTTSMEWDDLVLPVSIMEQVEEIGVWIKNEKLINEDWGLGKIVKPGYRSLFQGASGTGKTLTATLLGKKLSRDVHRINLSAIISKYIGETEKNLHLIFKHAEDQGWILFFDEADAIFGKRTEVKDLHDRYANLEIAYLLQKIEDYSGLTILSSNLKDNFDNAILRRFQSIIYFPLPDASLREQLWRKAIPAGIPVSEIDFYRLASDYSLTGGEIVNVVQRAAIRAAGKDSKIVEMKNLIASLRDELRKNGRAND